MYHIIRGKRFVAMSGNYREACGIAAKCSRNRIVYYPGN